ncbi:MAG: hypothetical protein HYR94_13295 [Chloroflexi bacterium]|nr:hypothetical protein [Chloroflexota bacterium]
MSMTVREFWAVIHGMGLGAIFLLAFAGGLAGLYSLRPEWVTITGVKERVMRLTIGTWVMAVASWLTVVSGTYIVYPWYRAKPPEGLTDLSDFPRYYLLSVPNLAAWHTFAMEWKEHVAWFSPILAVAVAFVVWRYGAQIAEIPKLRYALIVLFVLAFAAAGIAGMFGAFITKAAPLM